MEDLKNIKFDFEFEDKKLQELFNNFVQSVEYKFVASFKMCIRLKQLKDYWKNNVQYFFTNNGKGTMTFNNLMFTYFGLKSSSVYNMLNVVTRFIIPVDWNNNVDNFEFIHEELSKFNLTKLFELLPLNNEQILADLKNKTLTANMTQKEIRSYVASFKGKTEKVIETEIPATEQVVESEPIVQKEQKKKSNFKPTDKYIDNILDFYRGYKTEDKQLLKLIILNLQNIKNHYLKELENSGN